MVRMTRHAMDLCSSEEFKLYRASLGARLARLSPADLKSRVRRSRSLRDKYRDLYRRRRRGMSEEPAGDVPGFSRTLRKSEIFGDALDRFEGRLLVLEIEGQEVCRIEAEELARESRLGRSWLQAAPRPGFGGRPGGPIRRVTARAAAGHFRGSNRRFQARRDSLR